MAKAEDLATSINDQRLQISSQLNNSISWPFMTILISWACLLFFGFGMLARVNRAMLAAAKTRTQMAELRFTFDASFSAGLL
jgi:hypothetical protein